MRFSLDETFDVGEDTGTPVVEDYVNKMPFAFSGTLKKLVVVLGPRKLTEEERTRLLQEEAKASIAIQWVDRFSSPRDLYQALVKSVGANWSRLPRLTSCGRKSGSQTSRAPRPGCAPCRCLFHRHVRWRR